MSVLTPLSVFTRIDPNTFIGQSDLVTLVNVYEDLVVFTRIADLDDRYSNLFLNAYINRHVHAEYLKRI